MAGKVFINCRRDDSVGTAGRLHDRLAQKFGRDNLLMDVDHIPVAPDIVTRLNSQVAASDVVLVIIGPNWLTAKDEAGQRRLNQPDDFVALEIAAALARNICIILVLVEAARIPSESELPDNLKPLARCQVAEIRDASFDRDVDALIARMGTLGNGPVISGERATDWVLWPVPPKKAVPLNKKLSVAEMKHFSARREITRAVEKRVRRGRAEAVPIYDSVECSVFGPPTIPPGETVLIQAFLHLPEQADRASFVASAADSSTALKGSRSLEIEIKRGARVEISLAVNGLLIDEPVQNVVWQGQPVFCQFLVTSRAATIGHSFFPVVRVSLDGTLVGCIKFRFSSDSAAANLQSRPLGEHARRYESAFVSYATKDRKEVLKRVQMLNVLKTKFFLDLLSLDPGDRWEKKLYETIGQCDLFLLFWSQAAKDSQWVIREVEYALNEQSQNQDGEPDIVPVIIEQNILPPPNLAALHFNDRIQYLISLMP